MAPHSALVAAEARHAGAPGIAGDVVFHGLQLERQRAARIELDAPIDAAFGLAQRRLGRADDGFGDVGDDAIERGGIDDARHQARRARLLGSKLAAMEENIARDTWRAGMSRFGGDKR